MYQSKYQALGLNILCLAWNHFYLEKVAQNFERVVQYLENITITVGFISQMFRVTYYWLFMLEFFTKKKSGTTFTSNYCTYWVQALKCRYIQGSR